MTAALALTQPTAAGSAAAEWAQIAVKGPQLAEASARYLTQIALSLRPASVRVADSALRQLCQYLVAEQPQVNGFRDVRRAEIEAFKLHLARRPGRGPTVSANTLRQRLGTLRTLFDRIGEWEWDDAPPRTPIYSIDLPIVDHPLPRFLDDAQAAQLLRAASADRNPLRRLVVHLLARTGRAPRARARMWANVASYPPRSWRAVLRRSSRLIVDGHRLRRRAISRTAEPVPMH